MAAYWHIYPYTIIGFLAVGVLTASLNYFSIPRLGDFPRAKELPFISILVPARNEAINIRACVESLLAQDYPDFEVLVLDDNSTDDTLTILNKIQKQDARLQILHGAALPFGWLGKHWACHQLAQAAHGEYLLFTDADTRHAPYMLRDSISALLYKNADLLTAFPHEEMLTWGERFTVPILSFSTFCFFPILLAEKFQWSIFSVTIGQFMLFHRSAYEAIGGYEAIRAQPVDDVLLGRRLMQAGYRWQLMDGTCHITCRMYQNFSSALAGFTKNLFAFFDYHLLLYVIGWFWISVSFLAPWLVLLQVVLKHPLIFPWSLAILAVGEALVMLTLAYHRFRFPLYLLFVYPLSLAIFAFIAVRSLLYSLLGATSWKGRGLARPPFKL